MRQLDGLKEEMHRSFEHKYRDNRLKVYNTHWVVVFVMIAVMMIALRGVVVVRNCQLK